MGAKATHVPLLTQITWLDDGTGATDVYAVAVGYEARSDLLSDASRGYEEVTADRVASVRVSARGSIVREYVLTYQDDATSGGFSRLARVEHYGLGGRAAGDRHPVVFDFEYSQALGVQCTGSDCDRPYLVDMGTLTGALDIANGRVTLVGINADGLPDVLDTSNAAGHRFLINTLTPSGAGYTHTFAAAKTSVIPGTSGYQLGGTGRVQIFDVNGDGRSDLLNASTNSWLENGGDGDWSGVATFGDVSALGGVDFGAANFIDINDDKRVDLITSTGQTTTLYRNDGDRFSLQSISPLSVAVGGSSTIQFADMTSVSRPSARTSRGSSPRSPTPSSWSTAPCSRASSGWATTSGAARCSPAGASATSRPSRRGLRTTTRTAACRPRRPTELWCPARTMSRGVSSPRRATWRRPRCVRSRWPTTERDMTTGFVHMRFLDLDPETGRWDRFDPAFVTLDASAMERLGEASTGYAYVANNPGTRVDPSGLDSKDSSTHSSQSHSVAKGKVSAKVANFAAKKLLHIPAVVNPQNNDHTVRMGWFNTVKVDRKDVKPTVSGWFSRSLAEFRLNKHLKTTAARKDFVNTYSHSQQLLQSGHVPKEESANADTGSGGKGAALAELSAHSEKSEE